MTVIREENFVRVGVGVLILNEKNQVLLGLRNTDSEKADSELHGEGTWTCPGGKLEFQETPVQCALRETKEETSIEISSPEFFSVSNDSVHDSHFITLGFITRKFSGEPKVMEPDEITEWKWFNLNNLPKNIFFPSEKMIKNYVGNKTYSCD